MVNNLALELASGQLLTSDTTDLNSKSSWDPALTMQTSNGVDWSVGNYGTESTINTPRAFSNGNTTQTDADGMTQKIGNYYNFLVATAGSVNWDTISDHSDDSICPKNWKIPEATGATSFSNLLFTSYQIPVQTRTSNRPVVGGHVWNNDTEYTFTNTNQFLEKFPFSTVRSGCYYPMASDGNASDVGRLARIWSSTSFTNWGARSELWYLAYSNPNYQYDRYWDDRVYGNSIRCVAK